MAVQAVGGAAGNMIAIHNVVAASATVGLLAQEGAILRKTVFPMVYDVLLAGSLSFIWVNGIGFDPGTIVFLTVLAGLAWLIRALTRGVGSPTPSLPGGPDT